MEVYQFLVRRQGFEVSERGWFVYANGDASAGEFGDALRFTTYMIPYDGDDGWVMEAFRRAVELAGRTSAPGPGDGCAYCDYVERAGREHG